MQNQRLFLAAALLVPILSACLGKPKEPPPSTAIDDTAYADHVRVLASDDFAGRKPGTPGEEKTIAYLIEKFHKMGLKPGNGTSYVQQVPLLQLTVGADAVLSYKTSSASRELTLGKEAIVWSKRAVPALQLRGSELVFVGYGIVAPEYSWNDYANIDVHGKTVIVLANDPGYASKDASRFMGNAMSEYGRAAYKFEEAARQGAAGVLLVHDGQTMGYGWNAIQALYSGAQFELVTADGYAGRAAIEGWIQNDAAHALFSAAGLDFTRLAVAAGYPAFKAVPLGATLNATLHNAIRSFNSQNVIALWPGRRGHQYVMYTAHWDSLGVDTARSGHNLFNGAVENASGVAGLLAIAQSFVRTDPKPDRSIAFLATTAGEPELLGSEYYADNPVLALRETVAVLNVDGLLDGGRSRDVSILGFGNTDLEESARAEALLQGRESHPEPNPQFGLYFRSDSYSFARRGVPVLYVQSGIDSAARGPAWGKAQIDDYYARRYLQPEDQYSAGWNVGGAVVDLSLYYQVGLRVAMSRRYPRWYPGSAFRTPHRGVSARAPD